MIFKSLVLRTHSNVGYTHFSQRDRFLKSEEYMMDKIAVLLSGKVAQKVLFVKISADLENDRDSKQASDLATEMVKIYGMSDKLGSEFENSPICPIFDNFSRNVLKKILINFLTIFL